MSYHCLSLLVMVEAAGIALAGRGCACKRNPVRRRDTGVAKPRLTPLSVPDAASIPPICEHQTKTATLCGRFCLMVEAAGIEPAAIYVVSSTCSVAVARLCQK